MFLIFNVIFITFFHKQNILKCWNLYFAGFVWFWIKIKLIFVEIMVVPKSNSEAVLINESEPENKKEKRKCFLNWRYGLAIGGICLAIGVALLIIFTNKGLLSICSIFESFLSILIKNICRGWVKKKFKNGLLHTAKIIDPRVKSQARGQKNWSRALKWGSL